MVRIPIYKPSLGEEEKRLVLEALEEGWISSAGRFIEEFEKGFSSYVGKRYGVATSSGTTALHLAITALDIRDGDEVIVPDLTFVSPINAVIYNRAKPVIVDVDKERWCLDPEKVKKAISPKTKAIIAVHLYGNPCDMDALMEISKENSIYLIEDAAEAHGAEYKGRKVGSFGIISCFSFYANKLITSGEGGMALTDYEELYDKMKVLRDHGMRKEKRYWHDVIGFNYRMTNIQAAIGVAQLKKINQLLRRKREIAKLYSELLEKYVEVQRDPKDSLSSFWLFSILLKDENERENVIHELDKAGVETRRFFYPAHIMPPYIKFSYGNYNVSMNLCIRGINLPSYPELTEEEIKYTAYVLIKRI